MNYSDIHRRIRRWYEDYGRHELPWRKSDDPYRIYISEMMLQQTQVKTVLERFYFPFLERFPSLTHVAEASLDDVLHAWQGLGYYRRARYIHQTARIAAPDLPTDVASLVQLPGIGKSTAHAIACFSTGASLPVLDANIKRILFRFFAKERATEGQLWALADRMLDREDAYRYNQAMMDLGASVCLPKGPHCHRCPLANECLGQDDWERYPAPKKRRARPVKRTHYLLAIAERNLLMQRRESEMLGGLWELPQCESQPREGEKVCEIVHDYTHFRRIASVWRIEDFERLEGQWIAIDRLDRLPLSSLEKKIFEKIGIH